jgi:acetyl esterase/lipase
LAAPVEHRYGPHRSQVVDLWLPDAPGEPAPVAVVIHGGFWRARYGRDLMSGLCRDLSERGWAAWNLEYRRLGLFAGGGWPATLEDVAAGVDRLATVREPLDLDRVVAVGHSAGGQLALWAAARRDARIRLRGVVGQAAVSDLEEACRRDLGGGAVSRFVGGQPARHPERYAEASPAARLPLGVPQLLVHGGRDEIVPAELSERYADAARAAGDDVDLVVRPEDGHFEHLDPAGDAWAVARDWMGARV